MKIGSTVCLNLLATSSKATASKATEHESGVLL